MHSQWQVHRIAHYKLGYTPLAYIWNAYDFWTILEIFNGLFIMTMLEVKIKFRLKFVNLGWLSIPFIS